MKLKYYMFSLLSLALLLSGCYDRDIDSDNAKVDPLANLEYRIDDDTLRVEWILPGQNELSVKVSSSAETKIIPNNPTSYKYGVVKVGKEYKFTFNALDKEGNMSTGRTIYFTREGSSSISNLMARQVDGTKTVALTWELPNEKTSKIEVRYDDTKIELPGSATTYSLENASEKVYTIGVVSFDEEGNSSETVYTTIRVGSTKIAFLGDAATYNMFLATADDDEIAAGKWFFETYPTGTYLSFEDVKAGTDLTQYRVIWWIRDAQSPRSLLPAISLEETVISAMKKYYTDGGNLLLNTHATNYLWTMGRMKSNFNSEIEMGGGFDNGDVWHVNVSIGKVHDESEHPIYKGLSHILLDGKKCIPLIGSGWKENHNNIWKDICDFYGYGNTDENGYIKISEDNQIKILGTWDGINDYWMMANFEAYSNAEFKGTSIAIGIGAFEWNQNNGRNIYQDNIEKITYNALEYLKTK